MESALPNRILLTLSVDPPGLGEELEAWSKEHVKHMLDMPGIVSAQAFRIDPEHEADIPPGAADSRPAYRNLCVYEIADDFAGLLRPPAEGEGRPPTPPGGMGPNRPDGYIFTAVTEKYRRS